jgi:hypothetical protein
MNFEFLVEKLIKQLLIEMPHLSFNNHGQIISIDLKIEEFRGDYTGFVQYVKSILTKLNSDNAKNKFIEEMKQTKHLHLALEKFFNTTFNDFIKSITI